MPCARRITISFPPEIEAELAELRRTEKFCRDSWAEIIRQMIILGLASERKGRMAERTKEDV